MKILRLLLVMGILALTLTALCQAGDVRGRLVGKVVDSKGEPLADVKVVLVNSNVASQIFEVTTSKKGVFTQVGLDPVMFQLTLEKEGYVKVTDSVKIRAGQKDEYDWKMLTVQELIALTPVSPEEEARKSFNEAADLFNSQKYDEAKAALDKALEKNPKLFQAHLLHANIALQQKDFAGALPKLEKVIEMEPSNADAWFLKGAALNNLQKQDDAVVAWQEYLKLKPDDAGIMFNVGAIQLGAKKTDQAIETFNKLLIIQPDNTEAIKLLAQVYLQRKDYPNVKKLYNKYLELAPDAADAKEIRDMLKILP